MRTYNNVFMTGAVEVARHPQCVAGGVPGHGRAHRRAHHGTAPIPSRDPGSRASPPPACQGNQVTGG